MKRKLATIYLLTHKRLEIIQTMKAEIQIQHMFMKAQAIYLLTYLFMKAQAMNLHKQISVAAHRNIFFSLTE